MLICFFDIQNVFLTSRNVGLIDTSCLQVVRVPALGWFRMSMMDLEPKYLFPYEVFGL